MNEIKEKILLLLIGGLAFGYAYSPRKQWKVLKDISREWKKIDGNKLRKEMNNLYQLEMINKIEDKDGFIKIVLTEKGKLRALGCRLKNIKNKKEKWDGKWRMVAFDIPERYKKGRDALRRQLKDIGFYEMQKSVLVTPYNCGKDIMLLIDYFKLGQYVRFGVFEFIDNEKYFKKVFKLK